MKNCDHDFILSVVNKKRESGDMIEVSFDPMLKTKWLMWLYVASDYN